LQFYLAKGISFLVYIPTLNIPAFQVEGKTTFTLDFSGEIRHESKHKLKSKKTRDKEKMPGMKSPGEFQPCAALVVVCSTDK
jgi:hypothetical protein